MAEEEGTLSGYALVKSMPDDGTFLYDEEAPAVPTSLPMFIKYAARKYELDEANVKVYRAREQAAASLAQRARTEADVKAAMGDELQIGDTINAGDYVVVVGPKTTGKRPRSIVLPSVAALITTSTTLMVPRASVQGLRLR
jgi:hypothetical protein